MKTRELVRKRDSETIETGYRFENGQAFRRPHAEVDPRDLPHSADAPPIWSPEHEHL